MTMMSENHVHKVSASTEHLEAVFSFPVDLRYHTCEQFREYQRYLQTKLSTIMKFEDFCEMTTHK